MDRMLLNRHAEPIKTFGRGSRVSQSRGESRVFTMTDVFGGRVVEKLQGATLFACE